MYIKKWKYSNCKERGYALLQTVVILMIVICICTLLNKIIVNNYLKSSVIYTSDDVRTLNRVEEETLSQAEIYFTNNTEPYRRNISIAGERAKKIIVAIIGTEGELIKDDGYNNHSHIKLYCDVTGDVGSKVVKLKPKVYKSNYIDRCPCGYS